MNQIFVQTPKTNVVHHDAAPQPESFAFLLLDGFTLMAFAGAVEVLRLANRVSETALYAWKVVTLDGTPATSSAGLAQPADTALAEVCARDCVVDVGGALDDPKPATPEKVLSALRRCHAHGQPLIGLCTGSFTLAMAGLLRSQDCAVHWEYAEAFAEAFPAVAVLSTAFALGPIPTASGGAASAELFLTLVSRKHGAALAARVADAMLMPTVRDACEAQTASHLTRLGVRAPALAKIAEVMEQNLETTMPMTEIASRAGLSVRQVERLFARYLQTTPVKHYQSLRLERARRLLSVTDMSVTEVAMATGFGSPSHFSKKFRTRYGQSAYTHRVLG